LIVLARLLQFITPPLPGQISPVRMGALGHCGDEIDEIHVGAKGHGRGRDVTARIAPC
jgi:hypothetical protein